MASWCLFNSITRKVSNTNVALRHLLLETIGKKLGKEEALLNY